MEPIRSSVPPTLKDIIKTIVSNENSPFRNESELIRAAVGTFVTEFMEFYDSDLIRYDENTWEDVLKVIIQTGVFGISTVELKYQFPDLSKVMYYHLKNLADRGIIEFQGTWRAPIKMENKKVSKTSGYWQATETGRKLENVKGWKN